MTGLNGNLSIDQSLQHKCFPLPGATLALVCTERISPINGPLVTKSILPMVLTMPLFPTIKTKHIYLPRNNSANDSKRAVMEKSCLPQKLLYVMAKQARSVYPTWEECTIHLSRMVLHLTKKEEWMLQLLISIQRFHPKRI